MPFNPNLGAKLPTIELLKLYVDGGPARLIPEKLPEDRCSVCQGFPSAESFVIVDKDLERSVPKCPTCQIVRDLCSKLQGNGFWPSEAECAKFKSPSQGHSIIGLPAKHSESGFPEIAFWRGTAFQQFLLYRNDYPPAGIPQLSKVPHAAHIPASTDAACVDTARGWIVDCVKNHTKCSLSSAPMLPTRVVDIGSLPSDGLRLKISEGQKAPYACLSHCWGKTQTLMLRHDNIDILQSSFQDNQSVHRLYLEAVQFCRQLGIRYIWIDTLCIIQDDAADWNRESQKMCEYYSQCYICLAATEASDHLGRCSTSATRFEYQGVDRTGEPWHIFVRPRFQHIDDRPDGIGKDAFSLLTRAWVYQERRLSPRVLHFCGEEMTFECSEQTVCLCGRKRRAFEKCEWTKSSEVHLGGHRALTDIKDEKTRTVHEWNAFVVAYSKLDLTFLEDRLPAISGLARLSQQRRRFSGLPTGNYLAGLWQDCILDGLTWCVGRSLARYGWEKYQFDMRQRVSRYAELPRPHAYVAPTWSWASVLDAVEYPPFQYSEPLCKILEARVEHSSSDVFGRLQGGHIVLEARLLKTGWTFKPNDPKYRLSSVKGTRATFGISSLWGDRGMYWFPDYNIKADGEHRIPDHAELWLMPLASRPMVGGKSGTEFRLPMMPVFVKETIYLVLKKQADTSGAVYQRVGWAEYTGSSKGPDLSAAQNVKIMIV